MDYTLTKENIKSALNMGIIRFDTDGKDMSYVIIGDEYLYCFPDYEDVNQITEYFTFDEIRDIIYDKIQSLNKDITKLIYIYITAYILKHLAIIKELKPDINLKGNHGMLYGVKSNDDKSITISYKPYLSTNVTDICTVSITRNSNREESVSLKLHGQNQKENS